MPLEIFTRLAYSSAGALMPTARESIAAKVQAGGSVELTSEESADALKMIHELGRHEAAAINHARAADVLKSLVADRDSEITKLRDAYARDRRSLWDTFAAASLGAGLSVESAATQADQMMTRREGRRA